MFDSTRGYNSLQALQTQSGVLREHLTETITKVLVRTAELTVSAAIPMGNRPEDEVGKHYLVEFMKDGKYTSRKLDFASDVEALVEAILSMPTDKKQRLVRPD